MMNVPSPLAPSPDRPMSRELLLTLLNTALSTAELRYARRLSTSWLAIYPGDLHVNLLYARAFYRDKSLSLQVHALPILEELCKLDPEFLEAQELLADVRQLAGTANHLVAKACAHALSHGHSVNEAKNGRLSFWAKYVYEARIALNHVQSGDFQQIEKAEYFIHKALVENPESPLAAVIHLRTLESKSSMPKLAVRNLAQIYHERWPDCLQFTLSLSNELMGTGETNPAVEMLHQVVSKDVAGQVPKRMWGENHPYKSIWPDVLEASQIGPNSPQNIPVPAAIAAVLGWNQLSAISSRFNAAHPTEDESISFVSHSENHDSPAQNTGYSPQSTSEGDEAQPLSEPLKVVQTELERMADELKRPHIAHEDGRFPIYVIFTTRAGLASQYDPATVQMIEAELNKLVGVIHGSRINQEIWGSFLFFADDPSSTQPFGLLPAVYNDPQTLKLAVSNLDASLAKRGERIGALLIVGGPEIVPFHNLPNPVEDADEQVPSDNPYAARDDNYFISDWPVGRVSGGSGSNANALLAMLQEITSRYDPHASKPAWYLRLIQFLRELIKTGVSKKLSSFGYTAAVWRRASLSVFRSIGNPNELLVSPPVHACESACTSCADSPSAPTNGKGNSCLLLPDTRLAYFNLHGVPDASEWYGQSDPTLPEDGPEFPVAMRPQDIRNGGSAPRMVFTEACYGANIIGKQIDDAISLKFLASGTQAVIGSTCISYGSLSTPLSSADLLGRVFWSHLQEGFTAGESLRRAKIQLTREMNNRQGFLDAEDQKTLISFVLFGDPLAQPFKTSVAPKLTPHLSDAAVPVQTVCERSCEGEAGSTVSIETISHLKSVVAQYLPGMDDARVNLYHEHQTCANLCGHCGTGKQCSLSHLSAQSQAPLRTHRRVVTLSKNFERAQHTHRQYARLTLDERGKIVKMVVSH
jgi:hypothetical protein